MPPRKRKANTSNPPPSKKTRKDDGVDTGAKPASDKASDNDDKTTSTNSSDTFQAYDIPTAKSKTINCELRGIKAQSTTTPSTILIFTHGAGGGLSNPATQLFATGFSQSCPIVSFKGSMNLKSRVKFFDAVVEDCQSKHPDAEIVVGGRSMGARAAVMTALEHDEITKLVLVSYPLKSEKGDVRDQILLDLPDDKEVLFISGSEDAMCDVEELNEVRGEMKAKSQLVVVDGADHGMGLGSSAGLKGKEKEAAVEEVRVMGGRRAAEWVSGRGDTSDVTHLVCGSADDGEVQPEQDKETEEGRGPKWKKKAGGR